MGYKTIPFPVITPETGYFYRKIICRERIYAFRNVGYAPRFVEWY